MDSSTAPRQSPAWCLLDEQLSGLMFHGIKGHLHKHSPAMPSQGWTHHQLENLFLGGF